MNVAKSYIGWPTIGEIFVENKKEYIIVQNPKTGTQRKARVYSDTEYRRLYPDIQIEDKGWANLKKVLGFERGYIVFFPGVPLEDEWCKSSPIVRAHKDWGWYIPSTESIPDDCPHKHKILYWSDVAENDTHYKPEEEIKKAVKRRSM